jgi:hypothetical protein
VAQGVKVAGGASATAHLEQKKRKPGAKPSGPQKRTRVGDILFGSSSPLKAKGDSKDAWDEEASPRAATPLASTLAPPSQPKVSGSGSGQLPSLDISDQEAKSDEDGGRQVDIVGSPVGGAQTCDLIIAEANLIPRKASSSSPSSTGDGGKKVSSAEDDDHEKAVHATSKASHSSSSSSE